MSKTPYEIRLDLLKLANEVLTTPIFNQRDALIQEWHVHRESNPALPMPKLPSFPSTTQVLEQAKALNDFVTNG